MSLKIYSKISLLTCTAAAVALVPTTAFAQDAAADDTELTDIVVTAQKREQSSQSGDGT